MNIKTPREIIQESGWLYNEDSGRIPQSVVINLMETHSKQFENRSADRELLQCLIEAKSMIERAYLLLKVAPTNFEEYHKICDAIKKATDETNS